MAPAPTLQPGRDVAMDGHPWAPSRAMATDGHPWALICAPGHAMATEGHPWALSHTVTTERHRGHPATATAREGHPRAPSHATATEGHPWAPSHAVTTEGHPRACARLLSAGHSPGHPLLASQLPGVAVDVVELGGLPPPVAAHAGEAVAVSVAAGPGQGDGVPAGGARWALGSAGRGCPGVVGGGPARALTARSGRSASPRRSCRSRPRRRPGGAGGRR